MKNSAVPALFIFLSINTLKAGKSETSGAEAMQSRDAQVLAGVGQVNLMDFVMSLAYPHLNKKAEDVDGVMQFI